MWVTLVGYFMTRFDLISVLEFLGPNATYLNVERQQFKFMLEREVAVSFFDSLPEMRFVTGTKGISS